MQRPKLLYQVRDRVLPKYYSFRTEEAYVHLIKRFIIFHSKRHPGEMGAPGFGQFVTHSAIERLSSY